jgi:ketosteroid isomerase-like protein
MFADDIIFTSFTSPVRQIVGRNTVIDGTKRFYSSIVSVEIKDLMVDGDKACAQTHYELRSPAGTTFGSDVAEVFTVKDGKIATFGIYFDTAPFPK